NFIVDYDNVFLLTKDGEQFIMDENEIEKPRILNIFVFSIPILIYKKLICSNKDDTNINNNINNINDRNINDKSRRRRKELNN
ncbi:7085_t:CDS:1, partial [Entrophospora sp. SA101]